MPILSSLAFGAIGALIIYKGATLLIESASAIARDLGVPLIAIGFTIIAIGTSLPELIVGVIAAFGFLNRWNDTMATPLEDEPIEVGERLLAKRGWSAGKHAR